jgi:fermentation-respiration switch protein FrsA (DUF1100 family)
MSDVSQTPPSPNANEPVSIASPKRCRPLIVRLAFMLIRVLLIVYIAVGVALYFAQSWLIFPGASIHAKDAPVIPPADCELVAMQTRDGTGIAALFGPALDEQGRAARVDAAACPTILYLYGNGDCIGSSLDIFQRLRALGVNVMIPEYPGYRMSAGKPTEAGFYQTADAAHAWLKAQPYVDATSIIVMGRSIGAAPAIDLASRQPVAGLITISAFTSLDEMAPRVVPGYPTSLVLRSHFRNEDKIGNVKCPILLMHGDRDDFVPPFMMTRLAAKAGDKATTVTLPGCDHNDVLDLGGDAVSESISAFLKRLNLGPATPHHAPRASLRSSRSGLTSTDQFNVAVPISAFTVTVRLESPDVTTMLGVDVGMP